MQTIEIVKSFNSYLRIEKPDYAVMLTGAWGTGKTFFIKRYIAKLQTQIVREKVLYLPLYGIKNEADIEKQIWRQMAQSFFPKISKKQLWKRTKQTFSYMLKENKGNTIIWFLSAYLLVCLFCFGKIKYGVAITLFSALKTIGTTSLSVWIVYRVYNTLKSFVFQKTLYNVRLIVFDDFERADMSHKQLLAYINRYVEHLNKHVVIVCNEKEIDKKDDNPSSSFLKIQEKVIGKKILLGQNNDPVLETMFYQGDFKILKRITNIGNGAKEFFFYHSKPQKGSVNYRVWIICCREFESIFQNVPLEYFDDPSIFKKLLPHFFSLEYALHIHDFGENGSFSKKEANELIFPQDFGGPNEWFDQLFGLQSEARDILPDSTWKSIINEEAINENEVIEHWSLLLEKKQPLWLQFYNYLEKTDEEIKQLWEQLKEAYQSHSIKDPAQIISIFSSVLDMRINHCCPDPEMTDEKALQLVSKYIASIDIPFEIGAHKKPTEFLEVCKTYGHHQMQSREFTRVKRLFQNAQMEYIKKYIAPQNFNTLLSYLDQPDEEFDSFWYNQGMRLTPIFLDENNAHPLLNKLLTLSPKRMKGRLFAIIDHLSTFYRDSDSDNDGYIPFEKAFIDVINKSVNDKNIIIDHSKKYWLQRAVIDLENDLRDKNNFDNFGIKPSNQSHLNQ